jgi:hypothetical protein
MQIKICFLLLESVIAKAPWHCQVSYKWQLRSPFFPAVDDVLG